MFYILFQILSYIDIKNVPAKDHICSMPKGEQALPEIKIRGINPRPLKKKLIHLLAKGILRNCRGARSTGDSVFKKKCSVENIFSREILPPSCATRVENPDGSSTA